MNGGSKYPTNAAKRDIVLCMNDIANLPDSNDDENSIDMWKLWNPSGQDDCDMHLGKGEGIERLQFLSNGRDTTFRNSRYSIRNE